MGDSLTFIQKYKAGDNPRPIDFETSIAPDDSVRLLSRILEKLNYTKLYQTYSKKGKNNIKTEFILLKFVIKIFLNTLYS